MHGGDISLLANGKGVGYSLSRGLGGDNKVVAALLDLSNWLDILGHFDDIFWEFCEAKHILFCKFLHRTDKSCSL